MFSKENQLGRGKKKKKAPVRVKEYSGVNDLDVDGQKELFDVMYKHSEKKSFLSSRTINSEASAGSSFYVGQFAHVLAKGKYPKFKLYSKNIILLTNHEHLLLDAGTQSQREAYAIENNCDWGRIYELAERLKQEYNSINFDNV